MTTEMTISDLRAAITAALRRRGPNADLDVSPTCTPLGAWVSLAGGVIRGPDGAVIDVVARAGDDAKALRGVAFAVGLLDDGSDPDEEVHRLRAELALERERCVALVREIPACQPGAKATAARRWLDDRVAACVRAIEVDDETATCARSLVREARERAKAAEADLVRARAELDATREAFRAHLFCDECEELATRCHAESASFGCDAHGVGDGWADTTHAAAVRAAGGVR